MKKMMRIMMALVITVLCSTWEVQPAFAAELPAVTIPVEINLSGTLPDPAENYEVRLEAKDKANTPMPEGTADGVYSMTITGAGRRNFPAVIYSGTGIYTYTIYQVAGTNEKCIYDDVVYDLTVYVTNAEEGSGLEAAAVLYPGAKGNKQSAAGFDNKYEEEKEPVPSSTDPSDSTEQKPAQESRSSGNPKTGDETNAGLYMILAAVNLFVLVSLFLTCKRKQSEE